jgi:hypothetical protein
VLDNSNHAIELSKIVIWFLSALRFCTLISHRGRDLDFNTVADLDEENELDLRICVTLVKSDIRVPVVINQERKRVVSLGRNEP